MTYTDKSDLTIRGRRSSFFKNPSLGGTYTRHVVDQSEDDVFNPRWWDIHTAFSSTNQRPRRMGPFHALWVGHTHNPFNQSKTPISSMTTFGRLSAHIVKMCRCGVYGTWWNIFSNGFLVNFRHFALCVK